MLLENLVAGDIVKIDRSGNLYHVDQIIRVGHRLIVIDENGRHHKITSCDQGYRQAPLVFPGHVVILDDVETTIAEALHWGNLERFFFRTEDGRSFERGFLGKVRIG